MKRTSIDSVVEGANNLFCRRLRLFARRTGREADGRAVDRPNLSRWPSPVVSCASAAFLIRSILAVALIFIAPLGIVSLAAVQPRMVTSKLEDAELRLKWSGDSPAYRVERSYELSSAPLWMPALSTDLTNVAIHVTGRAAFFRVVAIPEVNREPVLTARRMEILDSITRKIATLDGQDLAADNREILKFMVQIPEFEAIGIGSDSSIYARFQDGRSLSIINNRRAPPLPGLQTAAESRPPSLPPQSKSKSTVSDQAWAHSPSSAGQIAAPLGIPSSRRAALFKATLPDLEAPILDSLVPAFTRRGYLVDGGEASLEAFMSLKNVGNDLGVLYIDSHGGVNTVVDREKDPDTGEWVETETTSFTVVTSTEITPEREKLYDENWSKKELMYSTMGSVVRKDLRDRYFYYCITPQFVSNYWSFAKNSLVYIDSCFGAHPDSETFWTACFATGAGTYLSWTNSVGDTLAFDAARLLSNDLLGGSPIFKESNGVPQRPFDFTSVRAYLGRAGLDKDPDTGAKLVAHFGPIQNGQFSLLAPSIQSMRTDERTNQLRITGLFDAQAPTVVKIVGETTYELAATVLSSRVATEVVCSFPAEQKPITGNVTVYQQARPSNTVPLTGWRTKGELIRFGPGLTGTPSAHFEFEFLFRSDLHSYRRAPHESSIFPGNSAAAAAGSTCRFVGASGVFRPPDLPDTSEEWMSTLGAFDLPLVYSIPVPSEANWFRGSAQFNLDGSLYLVAEANAKDAVTVITRHLDPVDGSEVEHRDLFSPDTRTYSPNFMNGTWNPFNSAINAGEGPTRGENGRVKWDASPALYPANLSIPGYAE